MDLDFVVAAVTAVLAAWLLIAAALLAARPRGIDLREAARFVPDLVRLIAGFVRDRSLGWRPRLALTLLLAYLVSPVDIVPDFIPLLGYADDVIIAAIALRALVRHAGPDALEEHWPGSAAGLAAVRRLAGRRGT